MNPPYILVVDDYFVSQRVLKLMLEKAGYKAAVASDGFEALRQIDSQAFDLVIMDIAMPGLDGIEVLSRIRSSAQHHELPVIMLTASGDDFVREKAKRVGASAFLTKPASSAEVLATVKSLLN